MDVSDVRSCPTCGQPVKVVSSDEGTSHYAPPDRSDVTSGLLAEYRRTNQWQAREIERLREDLEHRARALATLDGEAERLNDTLDAFTARNTRLAAEYERQREDLNSYRRQAINAEAEAERLRGVLSDMSQQLADEGYAAWSREVYDAIGGRQ